MMIFEVEAISDKGCVRENNEDHVLIPGKVFTDQTHKLELKKEDCALFAIADGMGGHNAGEVASEMILKNLDEWAQQINPMILLKDFRYSMGAWVKKAQKELQMAAQENEGLKGMGSTLTGIFFGRKGVFAFNAGDSRVYAFRKGKFLKLTTDHTLASATGSRDLPGNLLVNCICTNNNPMIEVSNVYKIVSPDTSFLICSDGLTDMLSDEEIRQFFMPMNLEGMIEVAKQRGGSDNISILCVRLKEK